ncbi:MAG: DUF3105 domain-containing protein [Acidimicrobiia bacterium]
MAAEASNPWPKRLVLFAGFLAFVGLVYLVLVGTLNEPAAGIPEGTREVPVASALHVEGQVYNPDEVPAGGQHAPIWINCGFYSRQVPAENVVHALEHGAVWVSYQPEISDQDLQVLRGLARPLEKVVVSPVPGQPSPVMATAWGFQLELETAEDPRLEQFVNEFAGALSAPEPGGACSGGVGNPG